MVKEQALEAALIAAALILLFYCIDAWPDQCHDFAAFVEAAEGAESKEREERQWRAWQELAWTHQQKVVILRAKHWRKAGGTANEAWLTCPNY